MNCDMFIPQITNNDTNYIYTYISHSFSSQIPPQNMANITLLKRWLENPGPMGRSSSIWTKIESSYSRV